MNILLNITALLMLGSCATFLSPKKEVAEIVGAQQENPEKFEKIKRYAYACEGCITGSSTLESINASGLELFQLKGSFGDKLTNNIFDIPVEYNAKVKKWIKFYTKSKSGKRSFLIHAERAGQYAPIMSEIMSQKGLPRDLIYLAMAESGFRNDARSWASAVGPWQFMPFTGKKFGLKVEWDLDERRDPFRATVAAGDYLSFLKGYFKDWKLAFAGYNAGEGKMGRAIKRYKTRDFWKISKGRYLKPETKNYVPKIMALAIIGKNLEHFGFTGKDKITFKDLIEFETIEVSKNTDLVKIAKKLNIPMVNLASLNPELKRWYTPDSGDYHLKVPTGKKLVWDNLESKNFKTSGSHQTYRIKKGANLKNIAKLYRVPVKVLEKLNGYSKNKKLAAKVYVKLPFRVGHNRRKNKMYADLYRPKYSSKKRRRKNKYRKIIRTAMRKGKRINSPKKFYTVRKGDTLWTVARRTGTGMNTLIRSNHGLIKRRMIRAGDRLAIR